MCQRTVINLEVVSIQTVEWYLKFTQVLIVMQERGILLHGQGNRAKNSGSNNKNDSSNSGYGNYHLCVWQFLYVVSLFLKTTLEEAELIPVLLLQKRRLREVK